MKNVLLLIVLVMSFLIGTIGFFNSDLITVFLIVLSYPIIGYLFSKGKIQIPLPGLIFFGFLIFLLVSLFISPDYERSVSIFLTYFLSFGVYLCAYNFQAKFKLFLGRFLVITASILSAVSLIFMIWPWAGYRYLDGYQLIFSRFGSHNHLGDFLVLPITYCLFRYVEKRKIKYLLICLLFLPFYISSFSRSAYLSLFIGGLVLYLYKFKQSFAARFIMIFTLVFLLCMFFLTTYESRSFSFLRPTNEFLTDNFGLKYKALLGKRDDYLYAAYLSIKENFWMGVGSGNFVYASRKYSTTHNWVTHSSHNIFLDIWVENGFIAMLFLLSFISIVYKNADKKSVAFVLSLVLIVNFQTDYTHRISLMLVLFFALIGLCAKESRS